MDRHHAPGSAADATRPNGRLFMCPALYLAACQGHTQAAIALVQHDGGAATHATGAQRGRCDVHEATAAGNTALHIAAEQGHGELVRALCSVDKSLLSSRNAALDTPLHCAARAGRGEAVSLLVRLARDCQDVGGVLGSKNGDGDTALHLAARHGHGAAVEAVLLAAPGLSSELNSAGVSPLYLAVTGGSTRAVRAIVRCRDASAVGPSSQNALHAAVFQSPEMVYLLLQWKPALAGEVDDGRNSPLHFASSDGDCPIVRAILHAHAPPSTAYLQDSEGLSALHVAAMMGHTGVVDELLTACPDAAELRDGRGGTFLHGAAQEGHSSVVSRALKKHRVVLDSVLNAQDKDGNTPLHLAVAGGNSGIVHRLVSSGRVRASVMNNDGYTPFDLAEQSTSFFSMVSLVVVLSVSGAQFRPRRQDHIKKWSRRDVTPWSETTSDSLAVVAVLIATVAFSAAFNVPGSYSADGTANLRGKNIYRAFLVLDTMAMVSSVIAVILLVHGKASRSTGSWKALVFSLHCIWVSLISMVLAFYAAVVAVIGGDVVLKMVVYFVIYYGIYVLVVKMMSLDKAAPWSAGLRFLWRVFSAGRRQRHVMRRIGRQYPLAGYYVRNLYIFMAVNVLAIGAVQVIYYLR